MQYTCTKCGCTEFSTDEIHTTGGNVSKLFNVQNKRFITVSCNNCGFTELYKEQTSTGMNVLDFLVG